MPKVHLKQSFIENPPLPTNDKAKVQYFDDRIPGFILEVTRTGKATYYLRYRDKSNRIRQARLGSTDSLGLEQAREKARVMRSQAQMGFNPPEQPEKIKSTPTFKEFALEKYIPYVKSYKRSWEYDQQTIEKRMMSRRSFFMALMSSSLLMGSTLIELPLVGCFVSMSLIILTIYV